MNYFGQTGCILNCVCACVSVCVYLSTIVIVASSMPESSSVTGRLCECRKIVLKISSLGNEILSEGIV